MCKYQVASLIFKSLLQFDRLQVLGNLEESSKIYNLQQVCGVAGYVKQLFGKKCQYAVHAVQYSTLLNPVQSFPVGNRSLSVGVLLMKDRAPSEIIHSTSV